MSTRTCAPARFVIGVATAASLCTGAVAAPVRIELKPEVQASQAQVVLGDVAHVYSADLALVRRLVELPVGHAPRAGDSVTVERSRLQQWVHARTGLRGDEIQWSGATELQVSMAARTIPGEQLVQVAQAALHQHLSSTVAGQGLTPARIDLQTAAEPAPAVVPATTTRLVARSLATVPPAPKMLVWVDAYSGERFVRAIPVRFNVSIHGQAQALARPAPAVARGDWARLVSQAGAVTLESRVQVLQDAQLGQVVRVRQANGTGSVLARVSGPGVLEIQP